MPEKLLVHVPRYVELEPGYRTTDLLGDRDAVRPSTLPGVTVGAPLETALLEPVSGRWMAAPIAPASTDAAEDWTATGTELVVVSPIDAGGGVQATTEGTAEAPWSLRRAHDLDELRGFYLDLLVFPPEDEALATQPLVIEWGGSDPAGEGRLRLTLRANAKSAQPALLEERSGTDPGLPWRVLQVVWLLDGPFYGQQHRLWIQPLNAREFVVTNRGAGARGCVARVEEPVAWAAPDQPERFAPWGRSPVTVRGVSRAWVVFRALQYYSEWHVETAAPRSLGYASTQDVTATATAFRPDQLAADESAFDVDLAVFAGGLDGTPWSADGAGQSEYSFRLSVAAPEDAATGFTQRAVVLDRVELAFDRKIGLDQLLPYDLLSAPGVATVLSIREDRQWRDSDSRLLIELDGDYERIEDLLLRPNTRWQWVVEHDGAECIRFDGLGERQRARPWRPVGDTWRAPMQIVVRSRFRQAEQVLFRGGIGLDGQTRSEAYRLLAEQFPLKTGWTEAEEAEPPGLRPALEFEVGTLADDAPLPRPEPGRAPALLPRIGTSLLRTLNELAETFGPSDRLRFVDRGGVCKLYVDQPSESSAATFYHSQEAADGAGTPERVLIAAQRQQAYGVELDDAEFYNEILVVGRDGDGRLLAVFWWDPASWTQPTLEGGLANPRYVGVRRTLIALHPELRDQGQLTRVLYALIERFYRFRQTGYLASHLVPTLYPRDRITLAAGSKPGGADELLEIEAMRSVSRPGSHDAAERYECVYAVRRVA